MRKIGWQNGTLVEKAKVTIDGTVYEVEPEEYDGQTALSAENFIQMENNVEDAINQVLSLIQGTVLYENSIGTSGNVALSENISERKRIRISGYSNINDNKTYFSQDFDVDLGVSKGLIAKSYVGSINSYIMMENLVFTNSVIERGTQYSIIFPNIERREDPIYITKVIGFNY